MNHILSLEVTDTLNEKILRISDSSEYNEMVTPQCPLLEVTLPGFVTPVQFNEDRIAIGFNLNLTACALEIQTEDCDSNPSTLSDGIYVIKYSLSPKDTVYVEYNYLRITNIMNTYLTYLCQLPLAATEPTKETETKMKLLQKIRLFIDAAKAQVEIAHYPKKGMELYTYAKKLLLKFDCKNC